VQHAAGLLATKTSSPDSLRYYDRFRNRLTFPVADAQGRVIAFGARALDAEPGAKYLNSPETPLYKKARALFALDRAAESIRRTGRAILVEGYFDAVLLHQAGFASTIASCGTALTAEQLEVLAGAGARELVLLFDGDQAGVAAPSRCAATLLKSEMTTYVARLPAGAGDKTDPDSFVRRRGAAALGQVLDAALPLTEHLIQRAIADHAPDGGHAPVEKKLRVVRELTPTVLATREGLARSAFEKTIARRLDLDIGPLRSELHRACAARTNRA
jgi:DNA primase